MKARGESGFAIPITMLMVSILMVLSTFVVAYTVASFQDAARTRSRAEILNVAEIGLKLALAEITPGLAALPNTYWSHVPGKASASVSRPATASDWDLEPTDLPHEFQLFANVRNWPSFADWEAWGALGNYPDSIRTVGPVTPAYPEGAYRAWTRGWWPLPRNNEFDDSYFNEDASEVPGAKGYPNPKPREDRAEYWLINNPVNPDQLAFPVRLGTSSVPVRNLYWYWLTETWPNTPTNSDLIDGGLVDPYWINSMAKTGSNPKVGQPNSVKDRDVGIGAWKNHREYADIPERSLDGRLAADDGHRVNPENGNTNFFVRRDRYNFLNTPVLKKIYTVDHRGEKIRVAVYCRMILREYFVDGDKKPADYPRDADGNLDFLRYMRRQTPNGGPNVIFYLVAVNESTAQQRGVRVQQAVYVPMGPANPQDIDATNTNASLGDRFSEFDGALFPGTMRLMLDKQLMQGEVIEGFLQPASGDLSYRIPQPPQSPDYTNPASARNAHPHWVYLIEWNGLGGEKGPFITDKDGSDYLSTNSALIWPDNPRNPTIWYRTPMRYEDNTPDGKAYGIPRITGASHYDPTRNGNGATPSAYADAMGFFRIGRNTSTTPGIPPAPVNDAKGLPFDTLHSRWLGPGVDVWGGPRATQASMSYILVTDLQIPDQETANGRFSLYVTATKSAAVAPKPE